MQVYEQAHTTPEGGDTSIMEGLGGEVIDTMLSLLDELDSEGYEQAMTELEVINSIEASLHVHY